MKRISIILLIAAGWLSITVNAFAGYSDPREIVIRPNLDPLEGLQGNDGYLAEDYEHLLDGDKTSKWCRFEQSCDPDPCHILPYSSSKMLHYPYALIWKADVPFRMNYYVLTTGNEIEQNPGCNWKSWRIYGGTFDSDFDATWTQLTRVTLHYDMDDRWTLIHHVTDDSILHAVNTWDFKYEIFPQPTAYKYYMLVIDSLRDNTQSKHQMAELSVAEVKAHVSDYIDLYDGKAHGIKVDLPENATVAYSLTQDSFKLAESPTFTHVGIHKVYFQIYVEDVGIKVDAATVTILPNYQDFNIDLRQGQLGTKGTNMHKQLAINKDGKYTFGSDMWDYVAAFSADSYNSDHGYENLKVTIPVNPGVYRITLGNCENNGSSVVSIKNENDSAMSFVDEYGHSMTSFSTTGQCYHTHPQVMIHDAWFKVDSIDIVTISCAKYTPYFAIKQVQEIPEHIDPHPGLEPRNYTDVHVIANNQGSPLQGQNYTRLFDNDKNTKWCTDVTSMDCSSTPCWTYSEPYNQVTPYSLVWKMDALFRMTNYVLTTGDDTEHYPGRNWKGWSIYGGTFDSDSSAANAIHSDENWTLIHRVENDSVLKPQNTTDFKFLVSPVPEAYKYYKLVIDSLQDNKHSTQQMAEMSMSPGYQPYDYDDLYDGQAHGIKVDVEEGATIKYGTQKDACNLTQSPSFTELGKHPVYFQVTKENAYSILDSAYVNILIDPTRVTRDLVLDLREGQIGKSGNDFQKYLSINDDYSFAYDAAPLYNAFLEAKTYSGKYGYENLKITVPLAPDVYRITIGDCELNDTTTLVILNEQGDTVSFYSEYGQKCTSLMPNTSYYHKNPVTNYHSIWISVDKFQLLTIVGAKYTPYFAIERVEDIPAYQATYDIIFFNHDSTAKGRVPIMQTIAAGSIWTVPTNHSLYKEGYTLTGWSDGDDIFTPGTTFIPRSRLILTTVFTANNVALLNANTEAIVHWDLALLDGAPLIQLEDGEKGFVVGQAEVDDKIIDVKMEITTSNPGLVNNQRTDQWCQINSGTTFTFPSKKGAIVETNSYNPPEHSTLDGDTYASFESNTAIYNVTGNTGESVFRAEESVNFYNFIKITYPVSTATNIDKIADSQSSSRKFIKDGQFFIIHDGEIFNVLGSKVK